MLIGMFKIRDNENCPCGSGTPYKNCCKSKQTTIKQSKKPAEVQMMERMRKSMKKCCLHPDHAHCKGSIKEAHALQNNKIISLLAGTDRHVYILDSKRQPLLIPMEKGEIIPYVGISKTSANKATVETCFCDYHDNVAFAAIEKGAPAFDDSNDEMKFVYAYKAFIFEYYKQKMSMDIYRSCFKDNPSAFLDKTMVSMYRMLQMKMQEFEPIKKHFDTQILAGTHNGIYTCAIKLPETIKFADYAFIAPDYDLNGKKISHTKKGVMHRLAITIFPEQSCSWVLMSCLDSEKGIYARLFNQMENSSIDKIKFYLNLILPLYSENMVLSPDLWTSWDEKTQTAYTFYANLNGPDAKKMGMAIHFGLKNASRSKNPTVYKSNGKINLFQ